MQPLNQHARINLAGLKAEIVRKIGPERSKHYFKLLDRLLKLKVNKAEFNKMCKGIVGRENIPLHNQFICAILENVYTAKVPPLANGVDAHKATKAVNGKEPLVDVLEQNGFHPSINQPPNPSAFSNGNILPPSPKKARTGTRERRIGDRRSALSANGKAQQSLNTQHSDFRVNSENGEFITTSTSADRRTVQQNQGLKRQADKDTQFLDNQAVKLSKVSGTISVHSTDQTELLIKKDVGEVSARRLINPPLGIPFCAASVGGARKLVPLASSSKFASSFNSGDLLDTVTLKERMEQIATANGLEGVSIDTAKLLNSGLDAYLKGLVRSCHELVVARSGLAQSDHNPQKHQAHLKMFNGFRSGYHYPTQSSSSPSEVKHEHRSGRPISLLDFRTAMELNPQQLGEDWPLLLEKLRARAVEEEM
ncbi:Transcriptional adapter like [Heracleum sosnowskyi]|uniref:Transcriptional adapter like n=1 Tax=Heracleum sosnowskyi TaxID=360622 RepID=A0AAD8HCT4_9APIA|nr:Transcriptional adapter like [Heracleum sosnowskyi]